MEYKYLLRILKGILLSFVFLGAVVPKGLAAPLELSLDDCWNLALKNNPKMGIAQATKQGALWDVEQAKSNRGFCLTYNYEGMRTNSPPSFWPDLSPVSAWNFFSNTLKFNSISLYRGKTRDIS